MSDPPVERRRERRRAASIDVTITGEDEGFFMLETRTVDVSPHGAAIVMDRFVLVNTLVEVTAEAPPFTVWARVRSNRTDQVTGKPVIGVQYESEVRFPNVTPKHRRK